jgi:hypothetical protein
MVPHSGNGAGDAMFDAAMGDADSEELYDRAGLDVLIAAGANWIGARARAVVWAPFTPRCWRRFCGCETRGKRSKFIVAGATELYSCAVCLILLPGDFMTDAPTDIPAVTTNLYKLLQPLQSEERTRVIKAALAMLGDDTPIVNQNSEKGGNADDDGDSDLPVKARQWMKKYDVTQEHLNHVFHIENGAAEVIAHEAPGSSMRAMTINAYVLTGISQFLVTGEAKFDDDRARAVCKSMGCFDKNNHAKFVKLKGNVIGGSKGSGWTLTGPGLKSGADLIKGFASA